MAELKRIGSFQSFSEMRAQKQAAKLAEEQASKRDALKSKFAAIVDELDIDDVNLETVEEGNAFIFAASKAKQEGKDEFEFNGKKYKVTLKADTGLKESEEVVEESVEETEEISEAIVVTGKRDAKKVMNTYIKFFEKYPALGRKAMGVPVDHHIGAVKSLYTEAMIDANFSREVPATKNVMKGRLFPIEVKVADLNNATIKISAGRLSDICSQNASIISNAAKWSGIGIVEGTAMYLDSIGKTKEAEELMAKFNAAFESVELMEAKNAQAMEEGNAFSTARLKAIEAGEDEFEFNGKTYKVTKKDAEDEKLADELANESEINGENTNPEGYPSPAGDSDDVEETEAAEEVEVMEAEATEEVNEGLHPKLKKAQKAIKKGETVYGENVRFPGRFKILELGDLFATVDYEDGTKPMEMASMNIRIDSLQFESVETEEVEVMEAEETDLVTEGEREEQAAMEIYTDVAGPDGKYSEDELAKADMDLYMEIVTAAGHKGSKAKKIADEFRKIATLESIELEEILDEASGDFAGWVAFDHKGNRIEISKDEATSIFGAKKLAIAKLKVPKSKESMVAIAPAVEESATNEAEVKSAEDFSEYAMTVLQKAFGEDFDEAKAQEVVDGLVSKYGEDYGAMVGALQSSLGESVEVAEKKADGTISDDEDERREALMAEVESAMDQLLAKIKADADDIGGSFRSPGIMYDAKKIMDTKLKRFK
jgi:hypothetical protein